MTPPSDTRLYLASQSPRRSELLRQIGVDFITSPANIDETRLDGESPLDFVQRMAREKAQATYSQLCQSGEVTQSSGATVVLGSDTIVVAPGVLASSTLVLNEAPHDLTVMGKPENQSHAAQMLKCLSGQTHEVITAVYVLRTTAQKSESFSDIGRAKVSFCSISDTLIDAYWNTGEPKGKAGGYAIQGFAATFIEQIVGSYSAVVGLPLHETAALLQQAKVAIWKAE